MPLQSFVQTRFKLIAKYYGGFNSDDVDGQGYFSVSVVFAWDF